MYAKYTWLATATEAQVRADIIALMCGQTDINALSASCDKPFSKIIANTTTSNWLIHDAAASATSQVLRSLNADGTTYKYVQVSLVSGVLTLKAWENWNATTHVGLNYAVGSASTTDTPSAETAAITYTTPNAIYIFSTPRYLITQFNATLGGVGCWIFEFSRDSSSLDVTYPCHVSYRGNVSNPFGPSGSTATGWGICRYKKPIASGDYTSASIDQIITTMINPQHGSPFVWDNASATRGVNEVLYYPALPIILCSFTPGAVNGSYYNAARSVVLLGRVQGNVYLMPITPSSQKLDELVYNNATYVMIPSSSATFIIPKA